MGLMISRVGMPLDAVRPGSTCVLFVFSPCVGSWALKVVNLGDSGVGPGDGFGNT